MCVLENFSPIFVSLNKPIIAQDENFKQTLFLGTEPVKIEIIVQMQIK